jgi:cysteine desulfurase
MVENYSHRGRHIITTAIEHHAILNCCKFLKTKGYRITLLNVDEFGMININELKRAIRNDTVLISVMAANNEIGTIMPLKEIGQIAHKCGILFHTDAVQAYCHMPIDVNELGIDLLSASAHKIGGPKGCGFLYVRDTVKLSPMIFGGAQEGNMRGGTENVSGIVGMARAAQISLSKLQEYQNLCGLRDYMIGRLTTEIPFSRLNGHQVKRLAGNVNVSFQFVNGESLLLMLDMEGVCASAGSACTTGQKNPSHVLTAMGLPQEIAFGTVRFTLSYDTTLAQVNKVIELTKKLVAQMREKSPQYQSLINTK